MAKILIADDEPDILKVVTFRLEKKGYDLIIATNGDDALKLARERKPDLILLDVSMPGMQGDEVCCAIKADESVQHIPVLLMTASTYAVTEGNIEEIQAQGFILKPFETDDFINKVEQFVS